MDKLEHLQLLNRVFMEDRPTLQQNNADIGVVLKLLLDEAHEALEVVTDPTELARELADVGFFLLTAYDVIEKDMFDEMREKSARNQLKRPPSYFKSGDFSEANKKARDEWRDSNGDAEFYS